MARADWRGLVAVAVVGWHAAHALHAGPSWTSEGQTVSVSDLPSVMRQPDAAPIPGQPPLPPEPLDAGFPAEGIVISSEPAGADSPLPEGDGGDSATALPPTIADRIEGLLPDGVALPEPGWLTYDSAAVIEPDGTVAADSVWSSPRDWMRCVGDACWVVRFEALALWRNAPGSRPLYTTFDQATQTAGPVIFNADQFESDPLAAPRLTIARLDECGRGFDASYLYAGTFYAEQNLPRLTNGYAFAPPGIYGNQWGPTSTPISAAQMQLTGAFQSAEFNLREPIGWGATRFLIGFRWFQWREKWSMTDQFEDPSDPTITGTDTWLTSALNNLYGGQIGLDSVLWNSGQGMRLEGVAKAGAYYNAANQSSLYSYTSSAPFGFDRTITMNGPAGASFAGEVGLTTVFPLSRHLDLRLGYTGLWLTGLAQPTRQLSGQTLTQFDTPAGLLTTNGTLILQGVSLGLEGRW